MIHFSGPDNKGALDKKIGTLPEVEELHRELNTLPSGSERAREINQRLDEIRNDRERPVCIRSTTLDDFLDGASIHLVAYGSNELKKHFTVVDSTCHIVKAMPPPETVKLAQHFLQNQQDWDDYNVISNNCETFACFCKTGLMNIAAQLQFKRLFTLSLNHERSLKPFHTCQDALENYQKK